MKTITTMIDGDYPVALQVNNTSTRYRVVYGKQVKSFSNWEDAAYEYACCVFHSLECMSLINREF